MSNQKYDLEELAVYLMKKKGLEPHFSNLAIQQLSEINEPAHAPAQCQDLRALLWCSIDNDDSRDLDQLTFADEQADGNMVLWVAIADVDALVPKDSPLDRHAQINTTSVYTPAKIFPMLPDKLSTDLTSLNEGEDRLSLVVKIILADNGTIKDSSIFHAMVRNRVKLTYNALGAWFEGKTGVPEKVSQVKGLESVLLKQNQAAQILKKRRHVLGALTLESPEVEAKIDKFQEVILEPPSHNLAEQLIEHFMIAANDVMANQLHGAKIPSLRRIVRKPKRWDRIIQIASSLGDHLPDEPDSKAFEAFLVKRKKIDPEAFPDLSLTMIKLLGRGEYIVEVFGDEPIGHFGLAMIEYTHSTAPNRRYPDLIAQRQYKAMMLGQKNPYSLEELKILAEHCTEQEDAAMKVERHTSKSAAAVLLSSKIGITYQGIVTGAGQKGTWARIFDPPVEGRIIRGFEKLDVGDRVSVQLVGVDIAQGYIDFINQRR